MTNKRIFTENSDRTHVLVTQIKTKAGKWIDFEKAYSKFGYDQRDYKHRYLCAMAGINNHYPKNIPDIRILNGMRKQVYGQAADYINAIFGNDFCATWQWQEITYAEGKNAKIASIRYKDSSLPDQLIMHINEESGWKLFTKVLQDISFKNDGFKSFHKVAKTDEDNNLLWFKVVCNSGLKFSVALYQ